MREGPIFSPSLAALKAMNCKLQWENALDSKSVLLERGVGPSRVALSRFVSVDLPFNRVSQSFPLCPREIAGMGKGGGVDRDSSLLSLYYYLCGHNQCKKKVFCPQILEFYYSFLIRIFFFCQNKKNYYRLGIYSRDSSNSFFGTLKNV